MQAELKSLYSPDIENLENYLPANPETFAFLLELVIGVKGENGGDLFNVMVCTPKWMLQKYQIEDLMLGRGKLIVFEYDFKRIVGYITKYCESCFGDNWKEIASKLSRMGTWEFEDYVEKL